MVSRLKLLVRHSNTPYRDGTTGHGIPNVLPEFALPWNIPNAQGEVINWNFDRIQDLLPAAFSMAVLGAIESLLCAVILE